MPSMSVYIGGLGEDTQKEDLEREFGRFGTMTKVWVARNPPGFAFIDFENDDDADEAIKEMNGATINGHEIRVDASRGGMKRGQGRGRGDGGFRGGRGGRGGGGFRGGSDRSFDSGFSRGGGGGRGGGGRGFSRGGPRYGGGGGGYDSGSGYGSGGGGGYNSGSGYRSGGGGGYDSGSGYRSRSPIGQRNDRW